MVTYLAEIYALTGEKDLALQELTTSARSPSGITYGELNYTRPGIRCAAIHASKKSSPRSR